MHSVGELFHKTKAFFEEKGFAYPRQEAEAVLAHVLKVGRLDLYMRFDCPLEEKEVQKIREALKRRVSHEPMAYIEGFVDFAHLRLKVGPGVLIPRPETEEMVDWVAKELEQEVVEGKVLWDLGCGSGCLGLALKKRFPALEVVLSDVSEEALSIARENAKANQLQVSFLKGSWCEPFQGRVGDFVVSNPPYIAQKVWEGLDREVRDFEPKLALSSGERGLEAYEALAHQLPGVLSSGAKVFFEIGFDQGPALEGIFKENPWKKARLLKDFCKKSRFFFIERE